MAKKGRDCEDDAAPPPKAVKPLATAITNRRQIRIFFIWN